VLACHLSQELYQKFKAIFSLIPTFELFVFLQESCLSLSQELYRKCKAIFSLFLHVYYLGVFCRRVACAGMPTKLGALSKMQSDL
jgi:hypothetical protein